MWSCLLTPPPPISPTPTPNVTTVPSFDHVCSSTTVYFTMFKLCSVSMREEEEGLESVMEKLWWKISKGWAIWPTRSLTSWRRAGARREKRRRDVVTSNQLVAAQLRPEKRRAPPLFRRYHCQFNPPKPPPPPTDQVAHPRFCVYLSVYVIVGLCSDSVFRLDSSFYYATETFCFYVTASTECWMYL